MKKISFKYVFCKSVILNLFLILNFSQKIKINEMNKKNWIFNISAAKWSTQKILKSQLKKKFLSNSKFF